MGRDTPVLLDLKPSGQHYMEDFHKAGGMATLLRELKPLLKLDALTVTGRSLGEEIDLAGPGFAQNVVKSVADPIYPQGGIAVLQGNLARSEEHTSELQSLMRISYAVFCLK